MSITSPFKPYKRKSPKTIAKENRAKKLNARTPDAKECFREEALTQILKYLYDKPLNKWNAKLHNLAQENAISQGRGHDGVPYSIFWNGKMYGWGVNLRNPDSGNYCLPLNPKIPTFAERMQPIAEELDELWEELYAVQRFVTNLLTFEAPPERFRKILGETIYRIVKKSFDHWFHGVPDPYPDNSDFSLRTFVEANKDIIALMNERVMLNIVSA